MRRTIAWCFCFYFLWVFYLQVSLLVCMAWMYKRSCLKKSCVDQEDAWCWPVSPYSTLRLFVFLVPLKARGGFRILELRTVINCHDDLGNWTRIFWKNSWYSQPLSNLSSPNSSLLLWYNIDIVLFWKN